MQLLSNITSVPVNLFKTCYEIGSDTCEYFDGKMLKIGKHFAVLSGIYFLDKSSSSLVAIGLLGGIAFPEFSIRVTNDIFTKIFHTKEPDVSYEDADLKKDTHKILWTIGRVINKIEPFVTTGFIGFFALPTVTIQAVALLAGARFGASGMRGDLF